MLSSPASTLTVREGRNDGQSDKVDCRVAVSGHAVHIVHYLCLQVAKTRKEYQTQIKKTVLKLFNIHVNANLKSENASMSRWT